MHSCPCGIGSVDITNPSVAIAKPSFAIAKPSFAIAKPSFAIAKPSFARAKPSFASDNLRFESFVPCPSSTAPPQVSNRFTEFKKTHSTRKISR